MEVTIHSLTGTTKFALFGSNYGRSCVTYSAGFKTSPQSPRKLQHLLHLNANAGSRRKQLKHAASTKDTTCTYDDDGDGDRWLLQPVGDGDSRHIGFKVPMPDAYEISSVSFYTLPFSSCCLEFIRCHVDCTILIFVRV